MGPLNNAKNALMALQSKCLNQTVSQKMTQAQTVADQIASGNCTWSDQFCNQANAVSDLGNTLSDLPGSVTSSTAFNNVSSDLNNGVSGCAQTAGQRAKMDAYNQCIANLPVQTTPTTGTTAQNSSPCGPNPAPAGMTVSAPSVACNGIVGQLRNTLSNIGSMGQGSGDGSAGSAFSN
jgi:hypothetical protein